MAVMGVMQPTVHDVIDVITVGHPFVSAAWPMCVRASGVGRATRGIGVADLEGVLVDVIPMHVMQMTIVEIIDMVTMAHGRVSTVRTMLVIVIGMMLLGAQGHGFARQSFRVVRQVTEALTRRRECLGHEGCKRLGSPGPVKWMALATSARAKGVGDQ
jgi:hypothetical protein